MGSRHRFVAGGLAVAGVGTATMAMPVSASGSVANTLLRDLSSPKGIAIADDGAVIVAQGAFGAAGAGAAVRPHGAAAERGDRR